MRRNHSRMSNNRCQLTLSTGIHSFIDLQRLAEIKHGKGRE